MSGKKVLRQYLFVLSAFVLLLLLMVGCSEKAKPEITYNEDYYTNLLLKLKHDNYWEYIGALSTFEERFSEIKDKYPEIAEAITNEAIKRQHDHKNKTKYRSAFFISAFVPTKAKELTIEVLCDATSNGDDYEQEKAYESLKLIKDIGNRGFECLVRNIIEGGDCFFPLKVMASKGNIGDEYIYKATKSDNYCKTDAVEKYIEVNKLRDIQKTDMLLNNKDIEIRNTALKTILKYREKADVFTPDIEKIYWSNISDEEKKSIIDGLTDIHTQRSLLALTRIFENEKKQNIKFYVEKNMVNAGVKKGDLYFYLKMLYFGPEDNGQNGTMKEIISIASFLLKYFLILLPFYLIYTFVMFIKRLLVKR